MPHGKGKGRKNRERNRNTDVEQIVEVHPALHFFISGNVNFANGAFLGALQDFSTALGILDLSFGPARQLHQLRVETLLGRAHCFFILGSLSNSIRDGAEAFNLSQEIGFQEGIYGAIQLNLLRYEHTDDIGGAFQLALLLKTIDSKKAKAHVGRLRDKVECVFREDPTLVDKLRDNLMSCGIKLFDKRSFKQAAEYFTEVVRLFCEFSFVREAYVYQAKCHFEMEKYEEARNNVKKVLEHHPDDEEGKNILDNINAIMQQQIGHEKGTKKKKSKRTSNSPVPAPVVPEKKPAMNKKQKEREENRRKREVEEIGKVIQNKIDKDREKLEQKQDKKDKEMDGAKSLPSFDVKAALDATSGSRRETSDKQTKVQAVVGPAHAGARPKQRNVNDSSRSTKEKNCAIKQHKDVGRNKNDKGFNERTSPSTPPFPIDMTPSWGFNSHCGGSAEQGVEVEDWASLPDDSFDSDCGASNADQTADTSSKPEDEWTLVTSKVNKPKPVAENTLQQNRNVSHGTGLFQDASTRRNINGFQEPKWRRSSKKERQCMRSYPKELNSKVPFQLCWHFSDGFKCQRSPCTFAHGEEELKFWTSERHKHLASGPQHENEFDNIQRPQERIQGSLTIRDTRTKTPRPPPTGVYHGNFQLCKWWKSGRVCRYGRGCTYAHGNAELRLWMDYKKENQEKRSEEEYCPYYAHGDDERTSWIGNKKENQEIRGEEEYCTYAQGDDERTSWMGNKKENREITSEEESSYQKPEKNADIARSEMVYSLPGVEVSCNKPAAVKIFIQGDETRRHIFDWVFTVTFEISEVGKLCQIDLLHRYHDCYQLTEVKGFFNNMEAFSRVPTERWSYKIPSVIDMKEGQMKVVVSLSFQTSKLNQTFTQCLRFDFGKKPYLLQGLNVDVASEETLDRISATRQQLKLDPSVWTKGSVDVVPLPETAEMSCQDLLLLEEYKLPERIENVVSAQIIDGNMSVGNYQRVMHQLLFTEELFMKKAISSFVLQNVPLDCQKRITSETTGFISAGDGELFGILRFQENESVQPDDAAGRLLIRNVQSAWLKLPVAGSRSEKVYKAFVQKVESECVMLKLSSQMCLDLELTDTGDISLDVQFQLNRQPLCEWHAAIDRLGPSQLSSLLFPQSNPSQVKHEETRPWNLLPLDPKLINNVNQREVIRRILEPGNNSSPLVVFGPFGTGKTFTLNQAIRHLVTKKRNRILLCTHTNSAADIHVQLLHDYLTKEKGLKATKPLRIYSTKRRLDADSDIAKTYGLIENNAYVLPTREDVIRHRVVITTLNMSHHLLELQLNHGFFTHILVDEAAQALEPEALTPLALAAPNTKVVFTGDHMQMSPEVYSHLAREWGLQRSLPERLFDHLYREEQPLDSKVMFLTENYRCHPEILQFPSDNFYQSGLIASGEQVSHPRLGAMLFYSVHGVEEARENSYINTAEVDEVVKRVKELANDWPVEWEKKDLSQIGVISAYMTQVRAIRTYLRKESRELQNVTVESIHNVQGKEFRALYISIVRTSLTCQRREGESHSPYWEFLSDPKLLNTAITRAKSLVAVVGDGVSLCTVGDCRGNWLDYIRRCHELRTLHGTSYSYIMKGINTHLAKISLNPQAVAFVPKPMEVDNKEFQSMDCATQPDKFQGEISGFEVKSDREVDNEAKSSLFVKDNNPTEENVSGIGMDDGKDDLTQEELTSEDEEEGKNEDEEEEQQKTTQSFEELQYQGDCSSQEEVQSRNESEDEADVENNTLHFFEEFRRETFEDETVFPKYFDKIIQALVEKCKETKEKGRRPRGSSESESFPPLNAAAISSPKKSNMEKRSSRQEKSRFSDIPSDDYQIGYVNGRLKVRLVNLGFHQKQSDRHERITAPSRQHHDGFLEPELLQKLMLENPNTYLSCTLRLNSEIFRMAYAAVSDTKTPDIKIKGRIRGVFDMDHVVVEKVDNQPPSSDGVPRSNGKIVGVLHHIISPHERQFVCKVDYENHGVMLPINKSVSRIVILSAKGVRGVPLYREIRDSGEKVMKVVDMDLAEVLSGNYMFLVQYLQWRSDCSHPLGIIVRKLPKRYTLNDSMEILFAEHGVRKSFDEECRRQVRAKFPPVWSIPAEENQSRKKIDGAFTIDPENSKDLDDALTLEKLSDSEYQVGVHIADVSYFVEAGTQLDKEALYRCTSYYPGHGYENVPMLPCALSENHCSLLPGKDRLCLSVFLDMSEEGKLVGPPQISRTIVRSSCQLTYSDAQKLIDGQESSLHQLPKEAGEKIKGMSALAQRRRKLRLGDSSFDHWSNSRDDPENFKAHELVEEMMLLANEEIAKFISTQMPEIAPLRTQLPPKDRKLSDWVRQYGQFIKHSQFLRGFYSEEILSEMTKDARSSEAAEFKVQESVWSKLCNAAESGDKAKLHELICNESNHPQLAVANSQFRRLQPKAQYVCEGDQPKENAAHFSLGMSCYTHFTSPIRRYIDIQVHRLVLHLISQDRNANRPTKDQVAKVCRRSTFAKDNSRKFDKACSKVHLAAKLKENSHETTAIIAMIEKQALSLEIPNQKYNHLSARQRRVQLSDLNLFTCDIGQDGSEIVLTWKLRLYIAPKENIIEEAQKEREKVLALLSEGLVGKGEVLNFPAESWQQILKALREGNYEDLAMLIRRTERYRQLPPRLPESNRYSKPYNNSKSETNMKHFYEKKMSLRTFDIVNVQLTAHMTNGVFHPEIQLFKINPSVHICVEHRKYPRDCFATTSRYQASRKTYASVDKYINAWIPVLAMEAATGAVKESDEFTIHHLKVQWKKEVGESLEGSFDLQKEYCTSRQIEFHAGDFVCVHVREDRFMKKTQSGTAATEITASQVETNPVNEDQYSVTQLAVPSCLASNSRHESRSASQSFWVGHCVIKHVSDKLPKKETSVVTMELHQSASVFPEELLNGRVHLSTLTVIHRSLPHRRMFAALCDLRSASRLVQTICRGHDPDQEYFGVLPDSNLSIMCGFKPLNQYQEEAVKEALVKPFTLVLGPPGTGKTVTGVHIAYWFAKRNNHMQPQRDQESLDIVEPNNAVGLKGPPQVIYCGPSNKSVDVVAKYMLQIPELKIIRVYGDLREQAEFPIPNKRKHLRSSTDDEDEELKAVSLHHVIRRDPCPFASQLQEYENSFKADREKGVTTSEKEVEDYRKLIGKAENWALQSTGVQIILCTCATAGSIRIGKSCNNIQQCIVDECGMCLEPESLVPITCSGARQVVLIGDHKQLQPVIQDHVAKTLGLGVSMFERLSKRAKMLELQYRMQKDICKFPSNYFYDGKLKTDPSVPTRDLRLHSFWPTNVPMTFCHVEGEEESSAIKTAQSNEQSKANEKEVGKVVHVARNLVYKHNVQASDVVILSPYREQLSKIRAALSLQGVFRCKDILVTTIAKSQGSECDYVILSLVRSLKKDELDPEPSLHWLREHLGFLTDEHLMNVGLTRARKGLCIIGNKNLLIHHPMWQNLIEFYENSHCLVDESDWPRN